jgi:hypothetical protein
MMSCPGSGGAQLDLLCFFRFMLRAYMVLRQDLSFPISLYHPIRRL